MAVTTGSAASVAAAANAQVAASTKKMAANSQTFLTLLTTQLKNQDPTAPTDMNSMTQQLTQMTGVEQQLLSNELLTKLVSQSANAMGTAVGLIGKTVTAASNVNNIVGGKADWLYELDANATAGSVSIKNSSGAIVHTAKLSDLSAGRHSISWNGKDLAGRTLADGGPYTATFNAADADGKSVAVTAMVKGTATGAEQVGDQTMVSLTSGKVPYSAVVGVSSGI